MDSPLSIYVAVDDRGEGHVLYWAGDDRIREDYTPSPVEAFAEEVSNQGRNCGDLLLPNPKSPAGVHAFHGEMFYPWHADPESAEPEFRGAWVCVFTLPPKSVLVPEQENDDR